MDTESDEQPGRHHGRDRQPPDDNQELEQETVSLDDVGGDAAENPAVNDV